MSAQRGVTLHPGFTLSIGGDPTGDGCRHGEQDYHADRGIPDARVSARALPGPFEEPAYVRRQIEPGRLQWPHDSELVRGCEPGVRLPILEPQSCLAQGQLALVQKLGFPGEPVDNRGPRAQQCFVCQHDNGHAVTLIRHAETSLYQPGQQPLQRGVRGDITEQRIAAGRPPRFVDADQDPEQSRDCRPRLR